MSQDLSIVITSVYTLADIQTDTSNSESENRQHGGQNVHAQHLNEYRPSTFCSSGDRTGNSTTKHNPASLKDIGVAGSTRHSGQRGRKTGTYSTWNGRICPAAEGFPDARNSHRSVFDGGDGARTLSVVDSCPSFCCRKNNALVRKLRAKSRLVDDLKRRPLLLAQLAVESGDWRAKRSTNVCDRISVNKSRNRVPPVAQNSESKYCGIANECSTYPTESCKPVEVRKVNAGGDSRKDEITTHEFQVVKSAGMP